MNDLFQVIIKTEILNFFIAVIALILYFLILKIKKKKINVYSQNFLELYFKLLNFKFTIKNIRGNSYIGVIKSENKNIRKEIKWINTLKINRIQKLLKLLHFLYINKLIKNNKLIIQEEELINQLLKKNFFIRKSDAKKTIDLLKTIKIQTFDNTDIINKLHIKL